MSVTRDGSRTSGRRSRTSCGGRSGRGRSRPAPAFPRPGTSPVSSASPAASWSDAYAQLAAEGYLVLRQGARPRVSEAAVRPRGRRIRADRFTARPPIRPPPARARRVGLPARRMAALAARGGRRDHRRRSRLRRPARGRGVALGPRRVPRPGARRRRGPGAGHRHLRVLAGPGDRLPGARRAGRQADRVRGPEPPRAASDRDRSRPRDRAGRGRRGRASGSTSSSGPTSTRSSSPPPTSTRPARSSPASGGRPARLAPRARRDRDRGRLRRRVPLRPRGRRGPAGPGARTGSSTPARPARRWRPRCGSAGSSCRRGCSTP